MSELKPLEERIKNLTIGLLGMADGETIQVNKSFLEHVRADMVELSKLRRAQLANDPLALKQPEVVRCKDCKYFTDKGVCTFYSVFKNDGSYLSMQLMDDDDFCSYGERKADAE